VSKRKCLSFKYLYLTLEADQAAATAKPFALATKGLETMAKGFGDGSSPSADEENSQNQVS
jgi:hypothetical protein